MTIFKTYRVEPVEGGGVEDALYFIREVRHVSERERRQALADTGSPNISTREAALRSVRNLLEEDALRTDNNLTNFNRLYVKSEGLVDALEMVPFELGEGLRELRERRSDSFACGPVRVSRSASDGVSGTLYVIELVAGETQAEVLDADTCHLLALAMRRAGQLIIGYQGGPGSNTWTVLVQHII